MTEKQFNAMVARLEKLQAVLDYVVTREQLREWYTVEEFGVVVKKAPFTVREWCRLGRVKAKKQKSGRGAYAAWAISHDELLRYQRDDLAAECGEGLLNIEKPTGTANIDLYLDMKSADVARLVLCLRIEEMVGRVLAKYRHDGRGT